jgi:hypothetical protein
MLHLHTSVVRALAIAGLALPLAASAAAGVYLEEMTSPELRDRIAAGATTALVPIGGTEQSGPHIVLGKHNVRAHRVVRSGARVRDRVRCRRHRARDAARRRRQQRPRARGTRVRAEPALERRQRDRSGDDEGGRPLQGRHQSAARDPVWDLRTCGSRTMPSAGDGSLTPIDPRTGKPGPNVPVDDPYNMYFTPDGKSAIVVAEARRRLDFRDPHTMAMQYAIEVPKCGGINHADFSIDGRYALFTCEFDGSLAKIDLPSARCWAT